MHVNQCSKCGKEFETKNPKRIVCPNCLYLDRAAAPSVVPPRRPEGVPGQGYGPGPQGGGYGPPRRPGGYPQQRPGRPGGPPRGQGFNRGGPGRGGPQRGRGGARGGPPKKLLIPREVLMEIEKRYKAMLPLPNPDAHVVIAEALNLEPNKVFFGINLVRQKMKLPKLDYPKRPLAVTPDQMAAVKALYEPFLPLPPIGVHKILAKQLRMDEWRVHVAIGLIRKQMAMPRWNEERDDLPPQMKAQLEAAKAAKEAQEKENGSGKTKPVAAKSKAKAASEPPSEEEVAVEE